ncbi:transcription termination/antitermination factor NusG [Ehrlichia chaffeensis str. Heartland]|uniref:Transcription termination/antitermination protein NusG n=1 Tax=Ehrlichia chaffeensis (strain ATCC CRL-10679 / Arkansas) TaxID=205920 RepID=Q2GFN8_EHRCR|nr:transcription termination/antitermination protein NusG [Ehrlichia chaffeensis]ABD45304.1 transcription antitermination protein NusG [Ehrlichia chaffeensis str. Arkansas]AHX03977.1 transcription termination/antitermination factor NusG [Ehrlichia chaffeensis str. Heartland]AHX05290.1 transcription termination/antitermination factor NusG [Ehrlichia chaffeensis str. Jax]AHX06278.1 transcription termination/antitermination factor NusG [Ehrlichia chaffeensis str. Liberty]AHX07990.1 transcription 
MKYEWYIIQVSSGSEEKVCQTILENSRVLGLEESFREVFIPYEEITRVKHNKKVLVKRKLSPGYVFLYMSLHENSMNFIRSIPRVLNFLNNDFGVPKVISENEMESMRKKMCQSVVDDTSVVNFEIGDEVVINDGLFQDFNGKVEYINDDKKIAGVSVMIFGRLTKIEFKLEHIQKVEG